MLPNGSPILNQHLSQQEMQGNVKMKRLNFKIAIATLLLSQVLFANSSNAQFKSEIRAPATQTKHRTVKIDGLEIFYREAGSSAAPTILLLHGFPTSSHMFRNLIPALADESTMSWRLIIPAMAIARCPRSMSSNTHSTAWLKLSRSLLKS